jgi:PmbA protein
MADPISGSKKPWWDDNMIESAKRIIEMAMKSGADEAEVFIIKTEGKGFSIEKNSVSSISGGVEKGIGIRVKKDKKLGFAFCTKEENALESIEQALSLSKLGKESEFSFPKPQKNLKIENLSDEKIINFTSEEALDGTMKIIEAAKGVDPDIVVSRGGVGFGFENFVIANSNGLEVEDFGTEISAYIGTVLKKNGMSTGFDSYSSRILDMNFESIGKNGAEMAMNGQGAKKIEDKVMTVLFDPHAISSLLEFITAPALYGEAIHKGESIYTDRLGEEVACKDISIVDDGTLSGGLNSAIVDDEGVSSKRNELIIDGVLKGFLYSQSSAIEFNSESTASAMRTERLSSSRNYKSPPTVRARNIVIKGDTIRRDSIISEIKDGVLVYEILGAHTSNPVSGDFSVNSSILFKIDNGEIAYPVKSAMLGGNFHECIKRISGIGDDYKMVSGGLTPISFHIPSVRVEGVRVTG